MTQDVGAEPKVAPTGGQDRPRNRSHRKTRDGNGLIITTIACDHHLHTPMYFFLLNLSLLDLGSISTTLPKAMASSLWDNTDISYKGCSAEHLLDLVVAVLYWVVPPVVNALIYSSRNQELKGSLRKLMTDIDCLTSSAIGCRCMP
ncbi:olfactory receptor 5AN1-like [Calypte anna]|uniref:olfactory receptor 5AN1-like n=1 Tax=Calypte anna TaxID=9244 RepID=UPI0011C46F00|nr:olfactory receptor 5AN1-like [Calypte anna]